MQLRTAIESIDSKMILNEVAHLCTYDIAYICGPATLAHSRNSIVEALRTVEHMCILNECNIAIGVWGHGHKTNNRISFHVYLEILHCGQIRNMTMCTF